MCVCIERIRGGGVPVCMCFLCICVCTFEAESVITMLAELNSEGLSINYKC